MTQKKNTVEQTLEQASQLLALRHGDALKPGESLYCELGEHEALQRLTVHLADVDKDRDFVLQVDFAADGGPQNDVQALMDALDFVDGVLQEFLASDGEVWPPLDPSPYTFEGRQLWLCGGVRRPKAEALAASLLENEDI